jgi:hypothetical protein
VSCAVHFEDNRTFLIVDTDKYRNDGQRAHTRCLCIDLGQIRHALGQDRHRTRESVIKRPLASFVTSSLNEAFAVCHCSSHADAHFLGELKQVRDRVRVHESIGDFLLRHDSGGVFSSHSDYREARISGLEAVLHLVETALRGKDGNVVIIVAVVSRPRREMESIEKRLDEITADDTNA